MTQVMTAKQFQEWRAYAEVEPLDGLKYYVAQVSTTLMNIWRDREKKKEPFSVNDFILRFGRDAKSVVNESAPKKDWRYLKGIAQMWSALSAKKRP